MPDTAPGSSQNAAALLSATHFVAATLGPEERIIALREGETRFAKQTYQFFRAVVARFPGMTGNEPVERRIVDVAVNVDTINSPVAAQPGDWRAFQSGYEP